MLSAYPERALEGIALVDASVQPTLRAKYVDYLVSQKRFKEAHEQVFLMPRDENFSFEAAIHLMMWVISPGGVMGVNFINFNWHPDQVY